MKKTLALIAGVGLMIGCTGESDSKQALDFLSQIQQEHISNGIDTTGVAVDYDADQERMEVSCKGETMDIWYNIYFKDLSGKAPQTFADDFNTSMLVTMEGATNVSNMEVEYGTSKFLILPSLVEPLGNGIIMVSFSPSEETMRLCMQVLASGDRLAEARVHTDKGTFRIPIHDVTNLITMAKSYVMDGGKFE